MKANRGYVVVVAWENTSEGRGGAPHYATIAPGYDYDKNTGCMVANVGKENGIKRERGKDGAFSSNSSLNYFYNPNQKFIEKYDIGANEISKNNYYPSIEVMEKM